MPFRDKLKENLSSAVQSNAEDKQQLLPNAIKKTLEDTKVPQAYLLRVFKALREQIAKHNSDIGDWKTFLGVHKGQMSAHEQHLKRYEEHLYAYDQHIKRLENIDWTGEPGRDGEDGVSPEIDHEGIVQEVLNRLPKNEEKEQKPLDVNVVISTVLDAIKDKKAKRLSIDDLDGLEPFIMRIRQSVKDSATGFKFQGKHYKFEELMHGGGSSKGGSFGIITVTGVVNDSNVTFSATTQPTLLNINGAFYQQTGGAITWSYAGTTITLSSPVGTGGQIYGIA